jgi:hypothetical protein
LGALPAGRTRFFAIHFSRSERRIRQLIASVA